jgi:pimeloyl-ACP methyl ester carboxylesterase
MIRKSVQRFSEKIMLNQKPKARWRFILIPSRFSSVDFTGPSRTLVMHARHDARVPFEMGRRLAAGIPGARLVPLESRNHIVLDTEPAFERFMEEAKAFIAG